MHKCINFMKISLISVLHHIFSIYLEEVVIQIWIILKLLHLFMQIWILRCTYLSIIMTNLWMQLIFYSQSTCLAYKPTKILLRAFIIKYRYSWYSTGIHITQVNIQISQNSKHGNFNYKIFVSVSFSPHSIMSQNMLIFVKYCVKTTF